MGAASIMAPMLTAGHPVESLFLAIAGHLKSGGQYETQRVGFSAAWLEFEDLFAAAMGQRRQLSKMMKTHPRGAPTTPVHAEGSDDECDKGVDNATPQKLMDTDIPMTPGIVAKIPLDMSEENQRREEQR